MENVKVFAPATVANVGCGYDTMGFALDAVGEHVEVSRRSDDQLLIQEIIGADLSKDPKQNVATIAIQAMLDAMEASQGFDVTITKNFKPGSGLGSSASSAAGAVFAVNELLGNPYTKEELLPFALEGEAFASKCYHADNVAPSLLGGFQVIRSYEPLSLFTVQPNMELEVVIVFPDVEVKTAESKGLLPKDIPVATARKQWANTAALVHALHAGDMELLNASIEDWVAEPVRKGLIPKYDQVKALAQEAGSVGFNISGSGPSMFALFPAGTSVESFQWQVNDLYQEVDIPFQMYQSTIGFDGCKVIS